MPDDLRQWIEKFNKRKGWQTIPIPDSNDNAYDTPRYEMKRRENLSEQEVLSVKSELTTARQVVVDLSEKLKVAEKTRGGEPAKVERELDAARLLESKIEARLEEAEQRLKRRRMATEQADELDEGAKDAIRKEYALIEKLEMALAQKAKKDKGKTGEDTQSDELVAYRKARDEAVEAIDKVRGEVIQLHALEGFESQIYNGVNGAEYTLLMTQLKKADLIADLGEPGKAMAQVRQTLEELDRIHKIRKGLIPIKQKERDHPELEEAEQRAKNFAATIRARGFDVLADELDWETRSLIDDFVQMRETVSPGDLKSLMAPMIEHAQECERDLQKTGEFVKAAEEFHKLIEDLRALNHVHTPARFEKKWDKFRPGLDLDVSINWANQMLADLKEEFSRLRERDMKRENIDPKALAKQLEQVRQSYESMFKHDRSGKRKTIKDSQTREKKGVKKDSAIPREALDEIEMKLMVAEMLLESNSVEAMKQAADYLDSVAAFQTNVSEDSQDYATAKWGLGKVRERLSQMDSRYNDYKGAERLALKLDADSFEERYKGQSPDTNMTEARELYQRGNALKLEVQALKARHEQFTKSAKKMDERLDRFGKLFKSGKYERGGVSVTGYYGELRDELQRARDKADQRDDDGLKTATGLLADIEIKFERWNKVVTTRFKKGREAMSEDDLDDWREIRTDCVSGQKAKNEEAEQGKKFKERFPGVLERAKQVEKRITTLKLDPTEAGMAVLELETLQKQMKSKPDFVRGLSELDRLEKSILAIEQTAQDMDGFKAMPIGKAAEQSVAQVGAFLKFAKEFDKVVAKIPDLGPNDTSDPAPMDIDTQKLRKFLDTVAAAVPKAAMDALVKHSKDFGAQKSLTQEARGQREKALSALRQITGHLESSAPVAQFRKQTFVPDSTYATALAGLSRLEVKLLTTIKS